MKISFPPQKIFSQKGQGLLEYALIATFVAAIAVFVTLNGGFGATITNLFGAAGDNVGAATESINLADSVEEQEETSFDATADESTTSTESSESLNLKPLNWETEIAPFANITYNTIARNASVDDALRSEIRFYDTLFTAVEGHLASTYAKDGTKDWENFLTMIENTKTSNNIPSTYTRDEQTITVKKVGKDLRITYSDKEGTYYYKLSPDVNNVMQVETNSNKSYSQFYSTIMSNKDGGGWQYKRD